MLKPSQLKTDSQINNAELTNLIMNQALEQIITLTGINKNQALRLMAEQFSLDELQRNQTKQPIIEQEESIFISHLFN